MASPSIPISYDLLKASLRRGLPNAESRRYWWPILSQIKDAHGVIDSYPDITRSAENLADMVGLSDLLRKEKEKNDEKVRERERDESKMSAAAVRGLKSSSQKQGASDSKVKLSEILATRRVIDNSTLGSDLESIIGSVIPQKNVCYLIMSDLFSTDAHSKYAAHDLAGLALRCQTLRLLLSHYMPQTFISLDYIGGLDDKYLNMIFVSFFKVLLPTHVVLRVLDCFLLEGVKILFRFGLALIKFHKRIIKKNTFHSGDQFWDYVTNYNMNEGNTALLFEYAFEKDRSLIEWLWRPMGVGRTKLKALADRAGSSAGSGRAGGSGSGRQESGSDHSGHSNVVNIYAPAHLVDNDPFDAQSNASSSSSDLHHDSSAVEFIDMNNVSHISESSSSSSLANGSFLVSPRRIPPAVAAIGSYGCDLSKVSDVLSSQMAAQLMSYLPETMKFVNFELAFSTSVHGYYLHTLYELTNGRQPCIVLIRGLNTKTVIGVFVTVNISPPSNKVRGDGQSICFRLVDDETSSLPLQSSSSTSSAVCRWIGLKEAAQAEATAHSSPKSNLKESPPSSSSSVSASSAKQVALEVSKQQFAIFSESYISVGGSLKQGTNAIRVDGDLKVCVCGDSDTYDNTSLFNDGKPFDIETIEVICGI